MGGKKIAPRNSEEYLVIKVIGDWTYQLVKYAEMNKSGAKVKTRHYNEIVHSDDRDNDDTIHQSYWIIKKKKQKIVKPITEEKTDEKSPAPRRDRYPKRERKPPTRLDITSWRSKKYDEITSSQNDYSSDDQESESGECDEDFESADSNSQ